MEQQINWQNYRYKVFQTTVPIRNSTSSVSLGVASRMLARRPHTGTMQVQSQTNRRRDGGHVDRFGGDDAGRDRAGTLSGHD